MVTPSPAQGAALARLGLLRTNEMPMVAAHWLVEFDAPALRDLAGLHGPENWQIGQLWPEVLAELGVTEPSDERAWDLAVSFLLSAWRVGERSVTDLMGQVVHAYMESGHPSYPPEAGHLYGLEEELGEDWGRGSAQVLAEVEQVLAAWATRHNLVL